MLDHYLAHPSNPCNILEYFIQNQYIKVKNKFTYFTQLKQKRKQKQLANK